MHTRCSNPRSTEYHNYGGRGITVCKRWDDFANFYTDMGKRPRGKTLGRVDNNKGYEPANCRWETLKEQNNNTRRNVWLTHDGVTDNVTTWANRIGMKPQTLLSRVRNQWPTAVSLTTPALTNPSECVRFGWKRRKGKQ